MHDDGRTMRACVMMTGRCICTIRYLLMEQYQAPYTRIYIIMSTRHLIMITRDTSDDGGRIPDDDQSDTHR